MEAISREEMLADLKKARVHRFTYIGAAIVLALLAMALVVVYFTRYPVHDIAAIILAVVAVIFSVLMTHQSLRTRKIEVAISRRIAELEAGEGVPAGEEPAGDGEGELDGESGSDGPSADAGSDQDES
ncbi:MAG: hypothetical protein ACYC99_04515 [Candidatus Geothermincolia bacterium]